MKKFKFNISHLRLRCGSANINNELVRTRYELELMSSFKFVLSSLLIGFFIVIYEPVHSRLCGEIHLVTAKHAKGAKTILLKFTLFLFASKYNAVNSNLCVLENKLHTLASELELRHCRHSSRHSHSRRRH